MGAAATPSATTTSVVANSGEQNAGIGVHGELLPSEVQDGLRQIIHEIEQEQYTSWRYNTQRFAKADLFFKGHQNLYFDYQTDTYREPTRSDLRRVGYDEEPIYHYPVNFYEAIGESIISVLGQRRMTVRFVPTDFQNPADVLAAKAKNDAKVYIDRTNKSQLQNLHTLYLGYVHGIFAAYTRWKVDEEFGTRQVPEYEMAERTIPGQFFCPDCGESTEEGNLGASVGICPSCGGPLDESGYVPERTVQYPQVKEMREVPNGQVVTEIFDGMELRLPYYAQDRKKCPFIGVISEIHETTLKDANPHAADDIVGGSAGSSSSGDDSDRTYRLARMEPSSQYHQYGTTAGQELVTWRRYWLRPYLYRKLDEKTRAVCLQHFPKGVHVEFSNDVFLKAFDESMDKHWEIGRVKPGVGMYTNSIGQGAIPMQQSYNFDESIKREAIEYLSFEPEFVDANVIDFQALNRRKIRAREMIPVDVPGNKHISDVIHQKKSGKGAQTAFRHAPDMFDMARFIIGAPPTLTGGTEKSLKPTTYTADRDMALGRKSIHRTYLHQFWAGVAGQQLDILAEHVEEDMAFQVRQDSGNMQGVRVKAADLKNGKAEVYPEADEQFPMLIEQEREMFFNLLQLNHPQLQELLTHPRNIEYGAKWMAGMRKLYIPGEDDRLKQRKENELLLESEPIEVGANPDDPNAEPLMLPSIMPEQDVDNHILQAEECQNFLVSPEGLRAKEMNQKGYANVVLHLSIHKQMSMQEAAMMQAVAAEPEAPDGKAPDEGPPAEPPGGGDGAQV